MQFGKVIGHATSTIKHKSFEGFRFALVQLLSPSKAPDGDAVIAVDTYQAGVGQTVVLNLDGRAARDVIKDDKSPIRYFVIALVDD